MTLTLYNTLTRRKEAFQPIDPGNVRVYACGPTVYDYVHIGNGRMAVVFDVLFRLLRRLYGADHVTYVRNITDVDDKINARAAEAGVDIRELTERTARQYQEDVAALGCLKPTAEPRATEYIRRADNKLDMVRLIETLVQRGHAYVADDHVLFDVATMPDYGRLSNRSLEEMEAGARVEVAPYKKGPMDFVLWKPVQAGRAGVAVAGGHRDAGPAGLAHRVLGHVGCAARRDLRHPRRRHRPRLPAPRERDRPVALAPTARPSWPTSGCTTASSRRPRARRCRSRSATSPPSTPCWSTGRARRCAWPSSPPTIASRCRGRTSRSPMPGARSTTGTS